VAIKTLGLIVFIAAWGLTRGPLYTSLWDSNLPVDLKSCISLGMGVVTELLPLGLMLSVLRIGGSSLEEIGFVWNPRMVLFALPLFLFGNMLSQAIIPAAYSIGIHFGPPGWSPPDLSVQIPGTGDWGRLPNHLLNGFKEELTVRSYLMTVVLAITKRGWIAVILSVAIQSSYHVYQSVPVALSHVPLFTIYALFFLKTRSILPVALAHVLTNLHMVWWNWLKL
jgi:membrane protease YdiL (CAAX protease family)